MGHHNPAHSGLRGCLHRASWPRFFEICRHDSFWAVPGAALPRSVGKTAVAFPYQLNLPTEALIDLKVRHRLGRFIPIWPNVDTIAHLRITVIPRRRPACRGDARRLCLCPDVLQYVADVGAVHDEGDDAHLPATQGAQPAPGAPTPELAGSACTCAGCTTAPCANDTTAALCGEFGASTPK